MAVIQIGTHCRDAMISRLRKTINLIYCTEYFMKKKCENIVMRLSHWGEYIKIDYNYTVFVFIYRATETFPRDLYIELCVLIEALEQ